MYAVLALDGKVQSLIHLLISIVRGLAKISAEYLRILGGMVSYPTALLVSSCFKINFTSISFTSTKSKEKLLLEYSHRIN